MHSVHGQLSFHSVIDVLNLTPFKLASLQEKRHWQEGVGGQIFFRSQLLQTTSLPFTFIDCPTSATLFTKELGL